MDLQEILAMPEGFTPPSVTVKIEKVFAYKSGDSEKGPWSFQDIQVVGGHKLKLKGLGREFPAERVGQTVTIRANSSPQHGLTGMKVVHENYQNKVYDKLIITPSAKWEWGASNGNGTQQSVAAKPTQPVDAGRSEAVQYADHLLGCAELANVIVGQLMVEDQAAIQACFATICIDTKNRGILLPGPKTLPRVKEIKEEPPADDTPQNDPFGDDIPF